MSAYLITGINNCHNMRQQIVEKLILHCFCQKSPQTRDITLGCFKLCQFWWTLSIILLFLNSNVLGPFQRSINFYQPSSKMVMRFYYRLRVGRYRFIINFIRAVTRDINLLKWIWKYENRFFFRLNHFTNILYIFHKYNLFSING